MSYSNTAIVDLISHFNNRIETLSKSKNSNEQKLLETYDPEEIVTLDRLNLVIDAKFSEIEIALVSINSRAKKEISGTRP